ncbi:MAG: cation-translocating P-type ATPase [Oscillospiraceae bacterium]|nr:cation-translocating P-type ATPase [Oscillospiraceae bacterium]
MHWLSSAETLRKLGSDAAEGLRLDEVRRRLAQDGLNTLSTRKRGSWFVRFLAQFKDFMVITLLVAAGISAVSALIHGSGDYLDSVIITGIVMINALIGVIQEGRAEKSLEALRKMTAPTAHVLRGGKTMRVPVEQLARGDILLLTAGDLIPADARLIEAVELTTQESALTGESLPCRKLADVQLAQATPLGDRRNTLLSSTMVLTGHGKAVVTATGTASEVGKIARMLSDEKAPPTPLQQRLEKVGRQLGVGAMCISVLIFLLGFLQHVPPLESFMLAISLAVAAIPEGLPAMVTVVLSIGVQRMARKNAIIRRLPAVETLGCASVICSDKTGTLTQNKMTVTHQCDLSGDLIPGSVPAKEMLRLAALCCNAQVAAQRRRQTFTGDPTETAIVEAATLRRIAVMKERASYTRLLELPFDSTRKRMSVVCRTPQGLQMIAKGAPDVLLPRCKLSEHERARITTQVESMAGRALRVIAVAQKPVASTQQATEDELMFVGLLGLHDPPRREAKHAVQVCKTAGIIPIMITGDHAATAVAIARELGMVGADGTQAAITGAELDRLNDGELDQRLRSCRVFARVTPEHKMRIVKALRTQGHVVAMTGDGVNDAPALKAADIGCAMGKTGTEVAKGAADMILTDDNFATIVHAVQAGRGIYDNIKKAVHFLISSNIGEVVAVFAASLMRQPTPLLPIQLLWVNVVTDSAPAIALGLEDADPHIMKQPPKSVGQSFFDKTMAVHMAMEGILMGAVTLLAFMLGRRIFGICGDDVVLGRTMAFTVLSFVEVLHANSMRSSRPLLTIGPFSNRRMNFANVLCIGLQVLVVTLPPLHALFGTMAMTGRQWWAVIGLAMIPTVVLELEKVMGIVANRAKKKRVTFFAKKVTKKT